MMNLSFLQIKSFCFCVSLRTGSKIVGFINLVGCIVFFIASTMHLSYVVRYTPENTTEIVFVSFDLMVHMVQALSSVILLLGVYQGKSVLIPWWLGSTIVVAVLDVVLLPSFFWRFFNFANDTNELVISCLLLVDDIYGWLVVYSYYKTLASTSSYSV